MKLPQLGLSSIVAITVLTIELLPAQAQYNCPVTYEQVQNAIREVTEEDNLYSYSDLSGYPRHSARLLEQIKRVYTDVRCENIKGEVRSSLEPFWKAVINAKYRARENLIRLGMIRIGDGGRARREGHRDLELLAEEKSMELEEMRMFFRTNR